MNTKFHTSLLLLSSALLVACAPMGNYPSSNNYNRGYSSNNYNTPQQGYYQDGYSGQQSYYQQNQHGYKDYDNRYDSRNNRNWQNDPQSIKENSSLIK